MAIQIQWGNTPPFYVQLNGTGSLTVTTTAAGNITASSSNTGVATVSPASASGPSATFTISGFGPGTATITFTDSLGESVSLPVAVIGPLYLVDVTPGGPGTQPYAVIQASETGYAGLLTPACNPQTSGSISGPGTVIFAGTGPSQNAPGPVEWIVTPAAGISSLTVDVFDQVGNEVTLAVSFVASTALPLYTVELLDFQGLNGVAAGFAWTLALAGLPEGTNLSPVDTGYTQVGGTIQSANLLANTYYTLTFEGNGAPPTPVTFQTGPAGTVTQTVQLLDYAPPMRGLSELGYTAELLAQYPRGWFDDDAQEVGGNAFAVTFALGGPLWILDSFAEMLRIADREETASGGDLVSWAGDFFGYVVPLPKLRGESDASYRGRIVSMLSGKVSTIANIQSVAQTYQNALGLNAQVIVFDARSNPGGAAQIPGVTTGVFVVLVDYPQSPSTRSMFADFSFADFSYAGDQRNTDFFLDNDFLDWNYLLPMQGQMVPMPIWDAIFDGIVRSRKSAGRVPVYASIYW